MNLFLGRLPRFGGGIVARARIDPSRLAIGEEFLFPEWSAVSNSPSGTRRRRMRRAGAARAAGFRLEWLLRKASPLREAS